MNTNTNTNTNTTTNTTNTTNTNTTAIEFKAIALKNERCLIYDVRCALIDSDESKVLSLVKAWIHAKDNGVVSDSDVRNTADALMKVAYTGKYASVKERTDGKAAFMDVVTTGRVKAWLYTIRRNGYKAIAVKAEKGNRPEEKAVKAVNRKTVVKLNAEDIELLNLIKSLRELGLDTDTIKAVIEKKAC